MKVTRIDLGDFLDPQGTPMRLPGDPQKAPMEPQEDPWDPQDTTRDHQNLYTKTSIGSETPDSSPLATRML